MALTRAPVVGRGPAVAAVRRRVALAALGVLVALSAAAPARAGSPFNLTVERSFATDERPVVRLDFTDQRTPLVVRVLRPRKLEQFLDGQLDLARSYEEPLAAINPGHYLIRGLNRTGSPLELLRRTLSVDFRKSFGGTEFNLPLRPIAAADVAAAPAELTQGPPRDFDVVREEFVDLQKGGVEPTGLYDFDDDAMGGRYQVRDVLLDPLPDGIYLVQGTQGRIEAQALLQVTSLAVQVKQSSTELVIRVIDRGLRPVAGAAVAYRDGRGRWQALAGATDANGELRAADPGRFDGRLVVRVSAAENRQALVDTDFLPAASDEESVFLVTDRPIFKPGERFFYKGTVRTRATGTLAAPATTGAQAHVRVLRADGADTGIAADVPVTPFASFSGQFDLDPQRPPGLYRLIAEIDGKPYGGEFRVRDYVKPTFYLELLERDPTIRPGETFHLRFRAKRYSGGVAPDVRYEVFVYRKVLDAPQFVLEAGGGLEAGHDYFGVVQAATALSEPKRLYSSVEARLSAQNASDWRTSWTTAPTVDAQGTAAITLTLPKTPDADADRDWIYTVVVRAMDRAGAQAVLSENVYMTLADAVVAAQFRTPVGELATGELPLELRATFPGGEPAPGASGHVELSVEHAAGPRDELVAMPFRADEQGRALVRVPRPSSVGRVRAIAVLDAVGEKGFRRPFRAEPTLALVAPGKGEAVVANTEVELYPERTVLEPGGKTRVLALLPAGWGASEQGVVWETLAGDHVFGTKSTVVAGRSRWLDVEARPEYGTGFYQTVTVPLAGGRYGEQTIGFRIVPSDKRLVVTVRPADAVAEPLKPTAIDFEVRDATGAPAADVELSVNVVDRAVYAVQPEIRPGILDFFYPLPRLNLATFYSDELQGYGYAAAITRPNFRMAALKSNVRPQKRDMRDTAGWFPHVVTDAAGRARVTPDMPANVTEWLVTAIAADRAGRVGEGTAMFRTAADLSIELQAPRFLRERDVVEGHVQADNHTAGAVTATVTPRASGGVALDGDGTAHPVAIAPNGQGLVPLRVSAPTGQGNAVVTVDVDAPGVRAGGPRAFDVALAPAALEQVLVATPEHEGLAFPATTGEARELRVRVVSGLLGLSLEAAGRLVSYPYGCTEQLAHTTVPNLVLLDLVAQAGITPDELKPLGLDTSIEHARENARRGVERIAANQKPNGGLALWPGDPEPSYGATVIAARALDMAARLKVEGAESAFARARVWLATAMPPLDASAFGVYELELLNGIGLQEKTLDPSVELVRRTLEDPAASIGTLVSALRIVALRRREYWFDDRLDRLVGKAVREAAAASLAARIVARVEQLDSAAYSRDVVASFGDLGFAWGEPAALARILGVLAESDTLDDATAGLLTRRLLERTGGTLARSTFETAEIVFGARALLAREAKAARQADDRHVVARTPAGGPSLALARIPGGFAGTLTFDGPMPVERVTRLAIDGARPQEIAFASLGALVPFAAVQPTANGLAVERTLHKIEGTGARRLAPGEALHRGDVIVSRVVVTRVPESAGHGSTVAAPSRFVVLRDAVPAIAEVIDEDRPYLADAQMQADDPSYWARVKETLRYPDRTERVLELQGGSFTALQVWRVAFGGRVVLPPARAFDMYDDEIAGNTTATDVVVE
jgi:uncharacterized protein YfaS (alpha-2-macroglobulin family)